MRVGHALRDEAFDHRPNQSDDECVRQERRDDDGDRPVHDRRRRHERERRQLYDQRRRAPTRVASPWASIAPTTYTTPCAVASVKFSLSPQPNCRLV